MTDNVAEYDEELFNTLSVTLNEAGKKIQSEYQVYNMELPIVLLSYYTYKCKIPKESTLKEWGSPTFYAIMIDSKSKKKQMENKLSNQYKNKQENYNEKNKSNNSCEKYERFRNFSDYEIERYFELVYSLKYGNSSYGDIEKLKEITNAKLCKLNNFH